MSRWLRLLAGLMGAAGVALAAAASHVNADSRMALAAGILLVHAPALLALSALFPARLQAPGFGLCLGASLFAGDMVMRVLFAHSLFPMAAPSGGIIMILSWLAVALSSAFANRPANG